MSKNFPNKKIYLDKIEIYLENIKECEDENN